MRHDLRLTDDNGGDIFIVVEAMETGIGFVLIDGQSPWQWADAHGEDAYFNLMDRVAAIMEGV